MIADLVKVRIINGLFDSGLLSEEEARAELEITKPEPKPDPIPRQGDIVLYRRPGSADKKFPAEDAPAILVKQHPPQESKLTQHYPGMVASPFQLWNDAVASFETPETWDILVFNSNGIYFNTTAERGFEAGQWRPR